jgi:GntR family transcriptional regulator
VRWALKVNPADAVPIWKQIEEGVRRLVASGALAPGGTVPSVRELAKGLQVNPATVAKAYQRLTDAGIVEVRRGEGTFVRKDLPSLSAPERRGALRDGAVKYASLAVTLGARRDEAVTEVERAWDGLGAKGGRA